MDPLLRTVSVALAVVMGLAGCAGPATPSEPTGEVRVERYREAADVERYGEKAEDLPTPVFLLAPPEATWEPPNQSEPTVIPLEWMPGRGWPSGTPASLITTEPIRWTFQVNETGTLEGAVAYVWIEVTGDTASTSPEVGPFFHCFWEGRVFMESTVIAYGCAPAPPLIEPGEFLLVIPLRKSREASIEGSSHLSFEFYSSAASPSIRPSIHVVVGTETYDSRVEFEVVPTSDAPASDQGPYVPVPNLTIKEGSVRHQL